MTHESAPDLLVLHGVRVLGFADTAAVAGRYGISEPVTGDVLHRAETLGWVQRSAFGDLGGWSLTERGRVEGERRLAAELDQVGGTEPIQAVYREFLPLNGLVLQACTDWQLRPTGADRLAVNDHLDTEWDAGVLAELAAVDRALGPIVDRLVAVLARFGGYDTRFTAALQRARAGDHRWVDRTDVDSCHRVWFELHEDLIATLGIDRSADQRST